jgi:hypothetical protein
MGVLTRLIVVALAVTACASTVKTSPAPAPAPPADSTFYDFYLDRYLRSEPSSVFAAERAALRALSPAEVAAFNWSPVGKDHAVYQETQTLRFVLPWLEASTSRDVARSWLISWYNAHCLDESARPSWGSDLATAQRALVLAYWLRHEERRASDADAAIVDVLRDALRLHRQYLLEEANFDGTMNAGVLQAVALGECARVTGSSAEIPVATRRLLATLAAILSPQGASLEHSAQYHFIMLAWTEAALSLYAHDGDAAAPTIRDHVRRMRRAGYFLVDPSDRIVQIGDSDSTVVPGFSQQVMADMGNPGAVFFDSIAGYAVFKTPPLQKERYAVFRIQPAITHPEHGHADAMSLVLGWDGETILGDAGRYRYGADGIYFASPPAHNSIFPETFLRPTPQRLLSSVTASSRRSEKGVTSWWARMDWNGVETSRRVTVSDMSGAVVVTDTVRTPPGARPPVFCWTWNAGSDVAYAIEVLESAEGSSLTWMVETHRHRRFRFRTTVSGAAATPRIELITGSYRPVLGWTSPGYGVKRPSWVALVRVQPGTVLTIVRTVIEPAPER